MNVNEDFQFRNSPEWIEYSHQRYLPLDEIRHRLKLRGPKWDKLCTTIAETRKAQSLPIFLPSINRVFWYFEADCIRQKISQIERLGTVLFDKIHNAPSFEKDFIVDAAEEEAITSAIHEGANTTRGRARQFIAQRRSPKDKAERMVINNYEALEWIKKNRDQEVSLATVLRLHAIVTRGTLEGDDVNYSGKFRDDTIYVGKHQGIEHKLIRSTLHDVINATTQNPRFIHPLIRGILLHYLVAFVHPFFDGNGRTARALFYFKCIKNDLSFVELLSISANLKEQGGRYIRAFENAVTHDGDTTYFVDFALDSLLEGLQIVNEKVIFLTKVSSLRTSLDLSDHQVRLLQRLALNKFRNMTTDEYATDTSRSHEMARIELKELVKKDLLQEQKIGKKNVYLIRASRLKQLVSELPIT